MLNQDSPCSDLEYCTLLFRHRQLDLPLTHGTLAPSVGIEGLIHTC